MKIKPSNILAHELIGLDVKVVDSRDSTLNNVEGMVVYETKKTLQIYSAGRIKTLPKDVCRFAFQLPQGVVEVEGAKLVARPEDRVKRLKVRVK
ncbi:MAG: ribonuclease P protein subunit [Thaumarchaeota archaeon]|jgi:ribonuclease P protein subunit POP4|nr:ribonuclease P protein subunit [Nitrososphaerota archaeon]